MKQQAMVELDRLEPLQKILNEMRDLERQRVAAEEQALAGQRKPAGAPKPQFDGQGWLDGMGKVINRPGSHKLIKGGKTLFYLRSYKLNLNDYLGKLVGVRGKMTEAPGWGPKVIEVEELEVLGE
ncbi:MAG: hypothetical protein HYZ53_22775 [Planctomycetes bacterium]|nr:hypothetical protein [Planctomycetota bacterium]